jgi:adenylyl cyclase-associated protein
VEWVQALYQVFRELSDYVKQYFPNGITWNPKGKPALEVSKSLTTSPAPTTPAAGGPPPPPPPPPGPPPVLQIDEEKKAAAPSAVGGLGAVFSELNKGEAVTKGLRKVEKSEMTHKNPALRASSTVPSSKGSKVPAPGTKPKPESMRLKKLQPKKELEGNKWTVVSCLAQPR